MSRFLYFGREDKQPLQPVAEAEPFIVGKLDEIKCNHWINESATNSIAAQNTDNPTDFSSDSIVNCKVRMNHSILHTVGKLNIWLKFDKFFHAKTEATVKQVLK